MKVTKMQQAVGAAVLALGMSAGANAQTVIDLFNGTQGPFVDNTPTAGDTGAVITSGVGGTFNGPLAEILGGNRDMFVSLLNNGGVNTREVTMGVNGGVLDFSVDSLARGRGQIQWDGAANTDETIDFTGLGGVNLGTGNMLLDIVFSDGGFAFAVSIYSSATQWTKINFISNAHPVPTTTSIPLAAFNNNGLCGAVNPAPGVTSIECGVGGAADTANVGAIVADIDQFGGTTSIDLTLDNVTVVPEPGILALMGLGLFGMVGFARRRKNVA